MYFIHKSPLSRGKKKFPLTLCWWALIISDACDVIQCSHGNWRPRGIDGKIDVWCGRFCARHTQKKCLLFIRFLTETAENVLKLFCTQSGFRRWKTFLNNNTSGSGFLRNFRMTFPRTIADVHYNEFFMISNSPKGYSFLVRARNSAELIFNQEYMKNIR